MSRKAGQIIARGCRTWLLRVFLGRDRDTGTRKYRNRTVRGSARDAQASLNQMLQERDLTRFSPSSTITLNPYLNQWLEAAAKPRLRPKSFSDYESLLRLHIRPVLGTKSLMSVEPLDIQKVYHGMMERGLSPRTVHYTHSVLQSAYRQAVRWRLIAHDPCQGVELPRLQRQEMQALSVEQCRALLKAAKNDEHYAVFALAITTGMRPSEYLALKWSDVDWQRGAISVSRTLQRINKEWIFGETKRKRSRRVVKLQHWILELLRAINEQQDAGPADSIASDSIFKTASGNPINKRNLVTRHFRPILEQARLPKIRLYDLRHTAATLAVAAGVPVKVVSEQLGHASIAFTLDVYSHVLPHMQDEAAAKVEDLLFGATRCAASEDAKQAMLPS